MSKTRTIMFYIQMAITVIALIASIYLLVFVLSYKLGGWMIVSYISIIISIAAMIYCSMLGFRRGEVVYQLSILPFLVAIFVNVILPNRSSFQIGMLCLLFALVFAYLIRQKDHKFAFVILILMIAVSLTFSVYSAINAHVDFLGDIREHFLTYLAMYLSIFIPTIMSVTITLTHNVRLINKEEK